MSITRDAVDSGLACTSRPLGAPRDLLVAVSFAKNLSCFKLL